MSWLPNVYYSPEKFGLTPVGDMEWSEPCYSFDLTVVWVDAEGQLYWASDSGCSCPSPFEDITSLDQLERGTRHDLFTYLDECLETYRNHDYPAQEVAQLKEKILLGGYR